MDAKSKFREGFIKLKRPFEFAELMNPLQAETILYAYSERPEITKQLTEKAKEERDLIENQVGLFIQRNWGESSESAIQRQIENLEKLPSSWEEVYLGEIVQATIEGEMCRFYPNDYSVIPQDFLEEILAEEGYHAIISPGLENIKEYKIKKHYLQSRGIEERIARKWAAIPYKDLVMFKPYYQLLRMFHRDGEIIPDHFYTEVEGISFKKMEALHVAYLSLTKNKGHYEIYNQA